MPKEIPGFYYDPDKNRYFPYKGPIPGSSTTTTTSSSSKKLLPSQHFIKLPPSPKYTHHKLLHLRELCGANLVSLRFPHRNFSFQALYLKQHASQPMIWKYNQTKKMANVALEHVVTDVALPHGQVQRDVLLSGGVNGLLCLFEVGMAGQEIDTTQFFEIDHVRPLNLDHIYRHKDILRQIGSPYGSMTTMPSDVSCIKVSRKPSLPTDAVISKHFLVTTLGSENAPGCVYLLDLSKPLDLGSSVTVSRDGFYELAAFKQTIWTADCDSEGMRAVIGTNMGAALLNLETGGSSWVLRCKSDVFSMQLDESGNNILCGMRNGRILTVDARQKHIKRSRHGSSTISMPSTVCCLAALKHSDQYFLASSMDGSIKLYDHRLLRKGAVQSYEGSVNSHTRIELGVDPSEKVVMSGGEDCYLRLWDIKSGELLFRDKFMNSIPSAVCWPRSEGVRGLLEPTNDSQNYRSYWQDHHLGAWVGSYEGIFYVDWL